MQESTQHLFLLQISSHYLNWLMQRERSNHQIMDPDILW